MKIFNNLKQIFLPVIALAFLSSSCSQDRRATSSNDLDNTTNNADERAPLTVELRDNMTPDQVLQAFKDGNKRFLNGNLQYRKFVTEIEATALGQNPYAIVLSCIDSRVPSETIFDKRIGDMFNHRVAGNIVNEDVLGGMEFATNFAGAKLIMVMGHTKCGAVQGAAAGVEYGNLTSLLNKIQPVVETASLTYDGKADPKNYKYVDHVSALNVKHVINKIREQSPELARMESEGKIKIVGSLYEVETGNVVFYD